MDDNKIISNCPLCGAHGLHVMGETEEEFIQQCLNCGYTSTPNFFGTKEYNENFQKLPEDIKKWAKEDNNKIWLPIQLTLPIGMLSPSNVDNEMKWTFFDMKEIPEEEQKNYPDGNGGFYNKMYDVDNPRMYDSFLEAMSELNQRLKEEVENVNEELVDEMLPTEEYKKEKLKNLQKIELENETTDSKNS